jgi:hypothetical protein
MATEYDLSVVRQLLMAAYLMGELDTMAFDLFRDLHGDMNPMLDKSKKVEAIVSYAERRGRVEELLAYTRRHNSEQYERFEGRLVGRTAEVEGGSGAAGQRLRREQEGLQKQYDLLSEKVGRVREALAVEADVVRKFQLEHQLAEAERERAAVSERLDEIDGVLG